MNYQPPRQLPAAEQSKSDFNPLAYFRSLHRKKKVNYFGEHWQEIANRDYDANELSKILVEITHNLMHIGLLERCAGIIEYLEENIEIWENKAIEKIETFQPDDLSASLRAFAIWGIVPSNTFMNAWEERVKTILENSPEAFNQKNSSISKWSLAILDSLNPSSDNKRRYDFIKSKPPSGILRTQSQAQIYDADLWFNDSSTFENPDQDHISDPSEQELCDLFNQAGFEATLVKEPIITALPTALDIKVFDPDTGNTIFIELDGISHFLNTRKTGELLRYNGKTLFKSRQIEKQAPDLYILRIDMDVRDQLQKWKKASTNGKQTSNIACRLLFNETIKQEQPGMYRAHLKGKPVRSMATHYHTLAA